MKLVKSPQIFQNAYVPESTCLALHGTCNETYVGISDSICLTSEGACNETDENIGKLPTDVNDVNSMKDDVFQPIRVFRKKHPKT